MIRVTRDQAELGDVPFIEFTVLVDRHNALSEDQATVCGAYSFRDHVLGYGASKNLSLRVEEAFREAWCFAVEKASRHGEDYPRYSPPQDMAPYC